MPIDAAGLTRAERKRELGAGGERDRPFECMRHDRGLRRSLSAFTELERFAQTEQRRFQDEATAVFAVQKLLRERDVDQRLVSEPRNRRNTEIEQSASVHGLFDPSHSVGRVRLERATGSGDVERAIQIQSDLDLRTELFAKLGERGYLSREIGTVGLELDGRGAAGHIGFGNVDARWIEKLARQHGAQNRSAHGLASKQ